jgi:hypothetical protein
LFVEQLLFALSQTSGVPLSSPQAANFLAVHCTHVPASHTLFPAIFEQSASTVQAVHAPPVQADAVGSVQSDCFKQATHFAAALSQSGFAPFVQSVVAAHSTHE